MVLLGVPCYLTTYKQRDDKSPRRERTPKEKQSAAEFAAARLGFTPDAAQREVLESGARRGILNCCRQWGKSTTAAAMAVHRAYTRPKSLTLVASPTERQSAELVRKAEEMAARLDIAPRGDGANAISLLFPNGSRIVGLPGTEGTVRGFSAVSLLLIDEASRMEDAAYQSLRPTLAVGGGDLWMMSTPYGRRGFFYETWTFGGEKWKRVSVPATGCERISAEHLEDERGAMSAAWFRQEYLCEFVDNGSEVFGRDLIESALDEDLEPMDGDRRTCIT